MGTKLCNTTFSNDKELNTQLEFPDPLHVSATIPVLVNYEECQSSNVNSPTLEYHLSQHTTQKEGAFFHQKT